ncbi:MAG: flagellar basal body rod protein FlgB [Pyrinomonadaceae bacterium]
MSLIRTDNITNLLQSYLDVQSRRSEVIAGNIANADTPGYVARELDFTEYLREAARQAQLPQSQQDWQGLSSFAPKVIEQDSPVVGLDGNTVDAGREMSELAQTGMNFNFGAKMLQSRLRLLRTAIREGK